MMLGMDTQKRFDGTKLGLALKDQGRSKRWLAFRLGVSESYVGKVIQGQRTFPEPLAIRAAELLGLSFSLHFELRDRSNMISRPQDQEAIPA